MPVVPMLWAVNICVHMSVYACVCMCVCCPLARLVNPLSRFIKYNRLN